MALDYPEESPRGIACKMVDEKQYYISESSVYRILKSNGLITTPVFDVIAASNELKDKTTEIHQMWQTDFTYLKVQGWGWCYLSTILDDYSRYIIHWELCSTMHTKDVTKTIDKALEKAGVSNDHRPMLLSDNGPCYISNELKQYIHNKDMEHIRGRPLHFS
ncbi:DDE-type integrase/transposase/recombinase [Flagellimonas onchidii]|uniref:DDE-type integrase/transposase/recombinase n=1 Tax=Flagellimonas onchidii TaxID=2562684 RepID=UPI0014561170|nr:DDE-type integrase/transposase/recombinase [Allomuricauda onchidii]